MAKDPFTISILPVDAGTLALCRMPGAVTELTADVQALADAGATCVLSLTPLEELADAGAGALPEALMAQGIDWLHLPVGDFGTPQPDQQSAWDTLAREMHARLDAGQVVAVHCRAGLGRTGMVALRLMAERGERPEAALVRLRDVRPGTVERPAQYDWAAQGYGARSGRGSA